MKKLIFFFLLACSLKSMAQCSISLTSQSGNTYTYTAGSSQAYYWSVGAGASISGSNTGQSVTVIKSGSCPTVYLTVFNSGSCSSCSVVINSYHIEEDPLQICISSSAPNFKKRGKYFLLDCSESSGNADWNVAEGLSNFTTVGSYTNTSYFQIIPKYQWMIGYSYTIQAFQPGTSTLIASYGIVIQDCDICTTCRTGSGNSSFSYLTNTKQLIYSTDTPGRIGIELIDPTTGAVVTELNSLRAEAGKNMFTLPGKGLQKNKIYIVKLIATDKTIITDKIVY